MRVLDIYCHPVETSHNAALHTEMLAGLRSAGHDVGDCGLCAEGLNFVRARKERPGHHGVPSNRAPVRICVGRLMWAETVVLCFATRCFGMPAMPEGLFDRVLMPGVALDISDPHNAKPSLLHIKRISAVVTCTRPRWTAPLMGDPPRQFVTRCMRLLTGGRAGVDRHAHHHMNVATAPRLDALRLRAGRTMARFA